MSEGTNECPVFARWSKGGNLLAYHDWSHPKIMRDDGTVTNLPLFDRRNGDYLTLYFMSWSDGGSLTAGGIYFKDTRKTSNLYGITDRDRKMDSDEGGFLAIWTPEPSQPSGYSLHRSVFQHFNPNAVTWRGENDLAVAGPVFGAAEQYVHTFEWRHGLSEELVRTAASTVHLRLTWLSWSRSGMLAGATDEGAMLWNASLHPQSKGPAVPCPFPLYSLEWNEGNLLALGGQDGSVGLVNTSEPTKLLWHATMQPGTTTALSWSADGQWLAAGNENGVIGIFEGTTGNIVERLHVSGIVLAIDWAASDIIRVVDDIDDAGKPKIYTLQIASSGATS